MLRKDYLRFWTCPVPCGIFDCIRKMLSEWNVALDCEYRRRFRRIRQFKIEYIIDFKLIGPEIQR